MDCDETPADTLSRSHTLIQLHTVTDRQQSSLLIGAWFCRPVFQLFSV